MNLSVDYDKDLFIVQINGLPINKGSFHSDNECEVRVGDIIRISTTYRRNFFVNGKAIGLQDKKDDAMYQNIYTLIRSDSSKPCNLKIGLKKENELHGDYFPVSLADAEISCPFEWRFFESSDTPVKADLQTFKEKCEIWDFGEYLRHLESNKYTFKALKSIKDYQCLKNVCGIVRLEEKYLWICNGNTIDGTEYIEKEYGSLSELTEKVPIEFFGLKPIPALNF